MLWTYYVGRLVLVLQLSNWLKIDIVQSREGFPPLAEGLGDVPQGTRIPRAGGW